MSIYFITSERAYLRETQSKRDKASEPNMFGIERGREREREWVVGEAVKRSRRKPVRILVISRKVFAQLVSTELGALNRESVLSRLPGIRGERYRPLQCVHFCSRLYVASPKGYLLPFHRGEFRFCQLRRRSVSMYFVPVPATI